MQFPGVCEVYNQSRDLTRSRMPGSCENWLYQSPLNMIENIIWKSYIDLNDISLICLVGGKWMTRDVVAFKNNILLILLVTVFCLHLATAFIPQGTIWNITFWALYHNARFLDCLASTNRGLVTLYNIGKSVEGRNIKVVRVSTGGAGKKAIFIGESWVVPGLSLNICSLCPGIFSDIFCHSFSNNFHVMIIINQSQVWKFPKSFLYRRRRNPCTGMDLPGHSQWNTEGHRGQQQQLLLLPPGQPGYLPAAPGEPRRVRV